jgi:hypothetical protein
MCKNSRGNFRAFRAAAIIGFITTLISCQPETLTPSVCETGECDAYITSQYYKDDNGYTHVDLEWDSEYLPYFTIDAHASRTNPHFYYNDQPVVSAEFDTDTYYTIGDSLAFTIPLYNPYQGLETYYGFPIPVQDTIVYLNQFAGMVFPIVQNDTRVYFSDDHNQEFTTKRTVGPIPPSLEGDTLTVYMKVLWDAGMESIVKDHYIEKYIIE